MVSRCCAPSNRVIHPDWIALGTTAIIKVPFWPVSDCVIRLRHPATPSGCAIRQRHPAAPSGNANRLRHPATPTGCAIRHGPYGS
jgi:hypothetical protein